MKMAQKAHDDVQKQVIFTKTGSKDLVTGKEKEQLERSTGI